MAVAVVLVLLQKFSQKHQMGQVFIWMVIGED